MSCSHEIEPFPLPFGCQLLSRVQGDTLASSTSSATSQSFAYILPEPHKRVLRCRGVGASSFCDFLASLCALRQFCSVLRPKKDTEATGLRFSPHRGLKGSHVGWSPLWHHLMQPGRAGLCLAFPCCIFLQILSVSGG